MRTVINRELIAGVYVARRDEQDAEVAAQLDNLLRLQRRLARVVHQPASATNRAESRFIRCIGHIALSAVCRTQGQIPSSPTPGCLAVEPVNTEATSVALTCQAPLLRKFISET